MIPEEIDNLTLPELCELLVENTQELLGLLNQKEVDKYLMLDKQKEVETIQSVILKKQPGSTNYLTNYILSRHS